jgi:hypothetical protein
MTGDALQKHCDETAQFAGSSRSLYAKPHSHDYSQNPLGPGRSHYDTNHGTMSSGGVVEVNIHAPHRLSTPLRTIQISLPGTFSLLPLHP